MRNKVTPPEIERLAILAEECGEVTQMVGKILRFGWYGTKTKAKDYGPNSARLEEEVGNLINIVNMMVDAGDISRNSIHRHTKSKRRTIGKHLKLQG